MKKIITCFIVLAFICSASQALAKKQKNIETNNEIVNNELNTEKPVKNNKEKPKRDKQAEKELNLNTTIEKTRNRSSLAMFLNPNLDVQEIRASHILVKKRKDAVQIKKDIENGIITFEDAAKQYSLCPTGVNGGDLGYFNRKRMDTLFTDVAFDLKIGQISDPVGTKFGWHLIKVYDKR